MVYGWVGGIVRQRFPFHVYPSLLSLVIERGPRGVGEREREMARGDGSSSRKSNSEPV